MSNIVDRFSKYLQAIEYPKQKASWNIAGILKGKNAFYRFDVREMVKLPDGTPAQSGSFNSQAEKMVIEEDKRWLIFDIEELHQYVKKENNKKVYEKDLVLKLEWNIIMEKD